MTEQLLMAPAHRSFEDHSQYYEWEWPTLIVSFEGDYSLHYNDKDDGEYWLIKDMTVTKDGYIVATLIPPPHFKDSGLEGIDATLEHWTPTPSWWENCTVEAIW